MPRHAPLARFLAPISAVVSLAGYAAAQPVLVLNSLSEDLAASGNRALGYVYDASIEQYVPYVWERGVGYTRITAPGTTGEPLRGSADLSALATTLANASDWGALNCFNGYCTEFDTGCTPGSPLPPPSPCIIPNTMHRWTSASGWTNLGTIPRVLDGATGRFVGGTRCDSFVAPPNDISGNGRFLVGGAWKTGLLSGSGGPASGQCGDFVAFVADAVAGTVAELPVQPGTTTSRADSVNHDGSVITGYDHGPVTDDFGTFDGRRICVWVNGVQSLLDTSTSSFDPYPVNAPGTVIAGNPSPYFSTTTFGVNDVLLVKWNRQPGDTWSPVNLGRPIDYFDGVETFPLSGLVVTGISDDGNTIVGLARYGSPFFGGASRPFIWNPSINGGVPVDLQTFIAALDPLSPILRSGFSISRITSLSADGNALGVSVLDGNTSCPDPFLGLATGNAGVLYLNGAGIACDPPRIALHPADQTSIQYTPFGVALNVFASGTWPMTFQWQREDPANPGSWNNLSDACSGFPYGGEWNYEGTDKNQLRVGQASCGNNRDGRYRVIITNACGTVTSDPATVSFTQGTLITQQPADAAGCPDSFISMFSIAVSNSADLTPEWQIAPASSPFAFSTLVDGPNTAPDGRSLDVFGATNQFLGIIPGPPASLSEYVVRCLFHSPCGDAATNVVALTIGGPACPAPCDPDFNQDGNVDQGDIDCLIAVVAGDPSCTSLDPDFTMDGNVDQDDVSALIDVVAGGNCP